MAIPTTVPTWTTPAYIIQLLVDVLPGAQVVLVVGFQTSGYYQGNPVIGISGLYHYWIFNENGEPNEGAPGLNDPLDHGYESDVTLPEDNPNWQVGVNGLPSVPEGDEDMDEAQVELNQEEMDCPTEEEG